MICAPTGMGKTLVAEAAIFEALKTGQRLYYTTPLVALTDQKFREVQDKAQQWGFPRSEVGLITGNRRENPDARICVVVAEILLNHLLGDTGQLAGVQAVVMDEFHYFNDLERGVVWELSLVLLPAPIRLMLLSATVGNPAEFVQWLKDAHGRSLQLVQTQDRKVPLEFQWIADKLLTEHLPGMVAPTDLENRSPALVFCFNRDECWEVAERLKGVRLIDASTRGEIEKLIEPRDFSDGVGPKLRQMLICGVGVHHAGVLPRHKEIVEGLFLRKLIPFVVCTETLAAGINLPARSVVLSTLLKGKRGEEKLIAPSAAHQMFGRAGRPQFDAKGYVHVLAHEDDVKIFKWKKKYDQIDPHSKDPGLLRARKDLERKKPSRRKTERYWSEGQLKTLIQAGPAKLFSRSMIPYHALIYLLTKGGTLQSVRAFLSRRFNTAERLELFQKQLDHMIANLERFGFLTRGEADSEVTLNSKVSNLLTFRSIDPLYGAFLVEQLVRSDFQEKVQAIESVLAIPPSIERQVRLPDDLAPGPLRTQVLEPLLVQMGIVAAHVAPLGGEGDDDEGGPQDDERNRPLTLPEMLKALFDARLSTPESVLVQPKWIFGGLHEMGGDFFKYVKARNLVKNEGLILRHLLRLVILAGEFHTRSSGDPDYQQMGQLATAACRQVDERYTERFLAAEEEARKLGPV